MLGRPRTRRPARAAAIAAATTLALAACGSSDEGDPTQGSGALAASVDGQKITVGEVQRTTRELGTVLEAQAASSGQPAQTINADAVVKLLVQVPGVMAFAKEEGMEVPSTGSIRQSVAQVLEAPSDETVDFLRANSLNSQLDEQTRTQLVNHLDEQKVTISPRYAAADGEAPDWLEAPAPEEQLPTEAP